MAKLAMAKLAKPRPRAARAKSDRHFVTALARGLDVLTCFHTGDAMLGNGELAARCGLPKSTVSRLAQTLERLGYLRYVGEVAKYRLGNAALGLGSAMLAGYAIRQLARPMMQEVADFSQAVVALGVRVGLGIIYVEVCRNKAAMTLSLDVGSRVPLATTAIGRAYFAVAGDAERQDIVRQLRAGGASWLRHRRGLEAGIEQHRKIGCCGSFGDWQSDIHGVAVGFRPGGSLPAMALNCGGPSFSLSRGFLLTEVRPRLAAVVRGLEEAAGADRVLALMRPALPARPRRKPARAGHMWDGAK
jgi:DNA-binding IclR family transcriptional regulator